MESFRPLLKVLLAWGWAVALPALAAPATAAPERNVAVVATQAQPASEPRTALVIGNTDYPYATLANPVNDARAIAERLTALRFRVTRLENASQEQMYEALRAFGDTLRGGGVGLFYYAGHALQVRGRNYLLPARAKIEREDEILYRTVDTGQVLDKMENARNRVNIVILDACRNNPFGREFRQITPGLAVVDAPHNTLIAFATAPGAVASDGEGRNGLYTQHLLQALAEPGASLEDVFKRVRAGVRRDSAGRQVPWESTSLEVDFYFDDPPRPAAPAAAAPPVAPAPDPLTVEIAFWDSVKGSPDPADYRAYLQRYPQGQFAVLAGNRLRALQAGGPAGAALPATSAPAVAAPAVLALLPPAPGPTPGAQRPPISAPVTPAAVAPLAAAAPLPLPGAAPPPAAGATPASTPASTSPAMSPLAAASPAPAAPAPTALRALPGPGAVVRVIAMARNGGQALTGSSERGLRVWNLGHALEQRRVGATAAAATALAVSADGRLYLSGAADRSLRLWDAASGTELARLEGHGGGVSGVLFGPTARYAVSADGHGELIVWDLPSGRPLQRARAAAGPLPGLALSADGRYLLTADADGLLRLWDLGALAALRSYGPLAAPVVAVAFADGLRRVVAADTLGRLWSWPAEGTPSLAPTRRIDTGLRPPVQAALAADGATALLAGADGELALWDTASGQARWRGPAPGPRVTALALDARGGYGLTADETGRLWRWPTAP